MRLACLAVLLLIGCDDNMGEQLMLIERIRLEYDMAEYGKHRDALWDTLSTEASKVDPSLLSTPTRNLLLSK